MGDFCYVGKELELFAAVRNWKSYWSRRIRPFLAGDVLEVGAGIGSNTPFLDPGLGGRWVCLEPDPLLARQSTENLAALSAPHRYEIVTGTIRDLDPARLFDTIVYIDVLEHIADDRDELRCAAARLRPGGRIVVLAPAHQMLFSPFDAAVGHFRRYDRLLLRSISPPELKIERLFYLDSAGFLLSTMNKLLLRQSMPTKEQLRFWDTCVIPISRICDRCLFHTVGKSIVGVWRRGDLA